VTDLSYGFAAQVYVLANLAIALGYLCVPWLVLPYIHLRRRTIAAGALFFLGCTGSHIDMVYDVLVGHDQHPPVGWVAVWWHALQAVGTWAFIMLFRGELNTADRVLDEIRAKTPKVEQDIAALPPGDVRDELVETLAALRVTHHPVEPPAVEVPDPALQKLPGKGEWVKAAPGVFMICGTLVVIAILGVYATLVVTGSPTDAFFRLINLFLNALGTLVTMATLSVGLVHARRTLENRRIALKGQEEAHRAADAAEAAARGVNGELTARIVKAAAAAAKDAAAQLQRERDQAATALQRSRDESAAAVTAATKLQTEREVGVRKDYEKDRRVYETDRQGYEADRQTYEQRRQPGEDDTGG
jgi:hypothetical protein